MKIAQVAGRNCVAQGLSIIRTALEYGELPEYKTGGKSPSETINLATQWFPRHTIRAWCCKEEAKKLELVDNLIYMGDSWSDFDLYPYICGFGYHVKATEEAHFVVGHPQIYGDMECCVLIAIPLEVE